MMWCAVTGVDVEARRQVVQVMIDDDTTTHEQWLDVVHVCQVYGYNRYFTRCAGCVSSVPGVSGVLIVSGVSSVSGVPGVPGVSCVLGVPSMSRVCHVCQVCLWCTGCFVCQMCRVRLKCTGSFRSARCVEFLGCAPCFVCARCGMCLGCAWCVSNVPEVPCVSSVLGCTRCAEFLGCVVSRVCRVCQVYGYHDCAMDILTCVTEMFSHEHATGDNATRYPPIDDRRYRPVSPPSDDSRSVEDSTWLRRQNSNNPVLLPPVKPASLPSLQLSDSGRNYNKKRRKRWANSSTASDADAEFSDATTADFTQ